MILVSASGVLVALHLVYTWPVEYEPWQHPYNLGTSLEHSESHAVARTRKPKRQKAETSTIDPPTKQELAQLKEALEIERGSLQYKRRGAGIYHVVYKAGKHRWKHVGSWIELKERLEEKISSI